MKKNQWLSLLLCFCLCLLPFGGIAYAADSSGTGYSFVASTGTLTITSNEGTTNWRGDTKIDDDATARYNEIKTVVLGENVTTIGEKAFDSCTALTRVDLSKSTSLTTIDDWAFKNCTALTAVEFPPSLTRIEKRAFYRCAALTSVDLSDCTSLTSIEFQAFSYCDKLTSVDLSDCTSLTTIGREAFSYCDKLKSVDWSGCTSLTTIGNYAFEKCAALTSVDLSNCTSLTSIGANAFDDCKALKSVDLPPSLTTIGDWAFSRCIVLPSINLSDCTSLTTIGIGTFYECEALTEVKFPPSLTTIGGRAFKNCSNLSELYFYGNNPPSLGTDAFLNNPAIRTVYCPVKRAAVYQAAFPDATVIASLPNPEPFFTPDNGDRWVVIDPGQNGAVSPAGGYLQGDVTFTVSPNAGWRGDYALIDGKTKVEIVDNRFTLNITEPLRIQIFYIAGEEVPLVVTPPATTPTTPPITANPQTGDSLLAGLF